MPCFAQNRDRNCLTKRESLHIIGIWCIFLENTILISDRECSGLVEQSSILDPALERVLTIIRRTIPKMGDQAPCVGQSDLTYVRCVGDNWVHSFWSGQLWLAYAETWDEVFLTAARQQRPYFFEYLNRKSSHDHDLGFLYLLSLVADYTLTGDAGARQGAITAAKFLANRFNAAGQFIPAWNASEEDLHKPLNNSGRVIIDAMENIPLLYWAARETGDSRYASLATAHAQTTLSHLIRPDGSTYHTYHFNPQSGKPIKGSTVQGYSDESCWSRGQAWGIHGFSVTYINSGNPEFHHTAMRLADYVLDHIPADYVPYWDYQLPDATPHYRDTSAAAITASGLLILADNCDDDTDTAMRYRQAAEQILLNLTQRYSTVECPTAEGLLTQGTVNGREGLVDVMLPYGDYFYLEALLRAKGRTIPVWYSL